MNRKTSGTPHTSPSNGAIADAARADAARADAARADAARADACKVFVAGLPEAITDDILRQLFEATGGTVIDVNVPKDRTTGRSRRFGFVTLDTGEEAHAARVALDGSIQGGKAISVRAWRNDPAPGTKNGYEPRQESRRAAPAVLKVGYQVTVPVHDAARVEQLLRAAQHVGIVSPNWSETRVFSWEGVPDASMRELRRAIGGESRGHDGNDGEES